MSWCARRVGITVLGHLACVLVCEKSGYHSVGAPWCVLVGEKSGYHSAGGPSYVLVCEKSGYHSAGAPCVCPGVPEEWVSECGGTLRVSWCARRVGITVGGTLRMSWFARRVGITVRALGGNEYDSSRVTYISTKKKFLSLPQQFTSSVAVW